MGAGRCPSGMGTLTRMGAASSGPHTQVSSTGLYHALVFSALRVPAGPGHTTLRVWSHQAEALPCWCGEPGEPLPEKNQSNSGLAAGRALESMLTAWACEVAGVPAAADWGKRVRSHSLFLTELPPATASVGTGRGQCYPAACWTPF